MLDCAFRSLLTLTVLLGPYVCAAGADPPPRAAPWRFWVRSARDRTPCGVSVGPPGPARYPQYADGRYPWYGYGLGVPTYNWGYFGANGHGTLLTAFRGYHENQWQWSWQRGN